MKKPCTECILLDLLVLVVILLGLSVSYASEQQHGEFDIETEYYDEEDDDVQQPNFRWSMFLPRFVEKWCFRKCRTGDHPKPFSRLVATRCQCLCPLNAGVLQLCPPSGGIKSCYTFCQDIGYFGGDCLYNESCFCYCGLNQPYNVSVVYQ